MHLERIIGIYLSDFCEKQVEPLIYAYSSVLSGVLHEYCNRFCLYFITAGID